MYNKYLRTKLVHITGTKAEKLRDVVVMNLVLLDDTNIDFFLQNDQGLILYNEVLPVNTTQTKRQFVFKNLQFSFSFMFGIKGSTMIAILNINTFLYISI